MQCIVIALICSKQKHRQRMSKAVSADNRIFKTVVPSTQSEASKQYQIRLNKTQIHLGWLYEVCGGFSMFHLAVRYRKWRMPTIQQERTAQSCKGSAGWLLVSCKCQMCH